jgi:putative endonuclease
VALQHRHCEERSDEAIQIPFTTRLELFDTITFANIAEIGRNAGRAASMKPPAVYIMASRRNGTLYTGVTSNLPARVFQHREGAAGFTRKYGCKLLVWYELHETMPAAIAWEKRIKGGSRRNKLGLIEKQNPQWRDLFDDLM